MLTEARTLAAPTEPGRDVGDTELALLLDACLGDWKRPSPGVSSRRPAPDWDRLLRLADRHRVNGLLAAHLAATGAYEMPGNVASALAGERRKLAFHYLRQTGAMIEAVDRLRTRGIPAIVLKGVPLALKCYAAAPELKQSRDIDLLVPSEHHADAEAMLRAEGYRRTMPAFEPTPDGWTMIRHLHDATELVHPDEGHCIELHHRLLWDPNLMAIPFPALEARAEAIEIGGTRISALGMADLGVFLCCHAAGHAFARLKWLADIARLISSQGANGATTVLDRSRELGCGRHVALTLAMLEHLGGPPAPIDARERDALRPLISSSMRIMTADERPDRLRVRDVLADTREMIYGLRLAPTARSKAFKVLQHLTNQDDVRLLGLGRTWAPLYAVAGRALALRRLVARALRAGRSPTA